jgi:nucleotide-binding universal stress UspA family protein
MAIVVGVDGSAESRAALRWALAEASLRRTPLLAVWARELPLQIDPLLAPFAVPPDYEPDAADAADEVRRATERQLDSVVAEVVREVPREEGVQVTQEAVEGHPADVLVQAARGEELLVVGSRGRGGFKGLLLGSVSQACAHHAGCPVVIVRPDATDRPG